MFQDLPFNSAKIDVNKFYAHYLLDPLATMQTFFGKHYESLKINGEETHPDAAQFLIFSLLNPIPTKRPRASYVYNHPWIQEAPEFADEQIIAEMNYILSLEEAPSK
jgi:hypothetical protein